MGYSGFEGRYYSLFESLRSDMGRAADLQTLITLLAYKWVAYDKVTRRTIPDTPFCESERRQIVFDTAIGLPTFFVKGNTGNFFLKHILKYTEGIRTSSRYPGYFRVHTAEYKKALVRFLEQEATDLIETLHLKETFRDLKRRIEHPAEHSTGSRLTRSILQTANAKSPFDLDAENFNAAAESYFRNGLRLGHMEEGVGDLAERFRRDRGFQQFLRERDPSLPRRLLGNRTPEVFWNGLPQKMAQGMLSLKEIENLTQALLLSIAFDAERADITTHEQNDTILATSSIY
jgi:hypothetical protein